MRFFPVFSRAFTAFRPRADAPPAGGQAAAAPDAGHGERPRMGARMALSLRNALRLDTLASLCTAAERGDADRVARLLRSHRIDPFATPADGQPAFLLAARNGHAEVLRALVADERFEPARCAFHRPEYWFRKNRPDVAGILLESPKVDPDARNADGDSLLHLAARQGRPKWVDTLLARADPDARDKLGRTPLHLAAETDHRIVASLLGKGANPNLKDMHGRTPLHLAAASARPEVLGELLDLLCRHGADPNAIDRLGKTAVAACVLRDQRPAMMTLLRHGASANDAVAGAAQALRQRGAAAGMTAVECVIWDLSRSGDLLHVAIQAKPAASMHPFQGQAFMEFMRRKRLALAPGLRLVNLSGMPVLINTDGLYACIQRWPAAFGIGTRFPDPKAAWEAICAGSIPWKLFNNESEEDCVVTGTLLGFGEGNARRYFESWRKNGFARGSDFEPHAMLDDFLSYKAGFPSEDAGLIHPPGAGLLATDSEESRELLQRFRSATDELNSRLAARHREEQAEDSRISRIEARMRFMAEMLFRPADAGHE